MIFHRWRDSWAVRVLFWAAATFAFAMAVLPHQLQVPLSPSDKVQHIAAFATLGLLSVWAYSATPVVTLIIRLSIFGALIELVQAIPVLHRDSDVVDWFADSIAAGLALLFVAWVRERSAGPSERCVAASLRLSRGPNSHGDRMTSFNDRERAFESKFAHDEEMKFRITARRNRLLGEWAARQMGLSEAESASYAKDVVHSDFEEAGDHDVVRKVLGDLTAAGIDTDEPSVQEALRNKEIEARRQIIESSNL